MVHIVKALNADSKLAINIAINIATGMQFLHASKITHWYVTRFSTKLPIREY